jgi:two-component system response regulator FlrC
MPAMSALPAELPAELPVAFAAHAPATPAAPAQATAASVPTHFMPAATYAAAPIEVREAPAVPVNLEHAVKASELQVIMAAIQSTDSRMEAAAKLGISPRTLRYKLAQLRERGMTEGAAA